MAGSFKHAVAADGQLLRNEDIVKMLENGGDWYEFAEEAYGMIYFLAGVLGDFKPTEMNRLVERARQNYREGITYSPGSDGRLTPAREANLTGPRLVLLVKENNGDEVKTTQRILVSQETYVKLYNGESWFGWVLAEGPES